MTEPTRCPFCESERTELISLFGSQLLLSQFRCKSCGSYFEAVRGATLQPEEITRGS